MDFSLNITPKAFSGISAKMPDKEVYSAMGEVLTAKDFKMRNSGSSLAFDVYKLPDFLSKTIFKLSKALISNENHRRNYSNGFNETLRFLKSAAKVVK